MWILAGSCAFIAGVGVTATQNPCWLVALGPAVVFAFMLTRSTWRTIALLLVFAATCSLLGSLAHLRSLPGPSDHLISCYNECGKLEIEATIAEEPEYGARYTRLLLDELSVRDTGGLVQVGGRILVTATDPRQWHYGQRVLLIGALQTPPALGDFDYAAYLALSGVYSTAFTSQLQLLDGDNRHPARAALFVSNSALARALGRTLPEPESSLAQSLLLGRRAPLPDAVEEAFARTGTAHLLAISGLHLGLLVAAVIAVLLAGLGRRHYLYVWLGLAAVWAYALFTGMRPPVVRAALMASTFLLAELAGRQKHAPSALALAAAIMVAIEPQVLWRTSFQLSVLAMGGLVLLFPLLRWVLQRITGTIEERLEIALPGSDTVTDIMAATAAATIAIWPVCAGTFGQMSLVALPVSLLTLPALPFALATAAAAAALPFVSATLAAPFAWLSWLFLTFIIRIVTAFSSLPWASMAIPPAPEWQMALYYAALCGIPLLWHRCRRLESEKGPAEARITSAQPHFRVRLYIPALVLAAMLAWAAVLSAPDGRLHVVFLDVGQGDCILIQTPSGRTILVDGGPDGRNTCALIDRYRPFWDRSLDVVVVTHAHADHLNGLLTASDRYEMSLVLEPPIVADSVLCDEWHERLAANGCRLCSAGVGQVITTQDDTTLEILHPPVVPLSATSSDIDNNGVVMRLTYGSVSFLLTADIRGEAEQYITHRLGPDLHSDVLKVPHHGSNTSSSSAFLSAVQPRVAVISVAEGNPYGHPHEDVMDRLESLGGVLLTTCDCGTIEFVTDGTGLWFSTETGCVDVRHDALCAAAVGSPPRPMTTADF